MKVKLFVKDKSAFSRCNLFVTDLEDEVNAWLTVNDGIRIIHITQSSNGGSFDTSKVWLSVWYEESAERGGAADPPRDDRFRVE
jgi:hypothetical protein